MRQWLQTIWHREALTGPRVLLFGWLGWCAIATVAHVPVWQSELMLWRDAVIRSPWLPRAQINHGKAIIAAGERERGLALALRGYELERRRQDAKLAARAPAR